MKDALTTLGELAVQLEDTQAEIAALEQKLESLQQREADLSQNMIPEIMGQAGVQEFCTKSVRLKLDTKVRLPQNSPKVHEWLRKVGQDGLIKSVVSVPFPKGKEDEARKLVQALGKKQVAADLSQTVAWNSLEKTVKEMLAEGKQIPFDDLGAHPQTFTKVERL